MRSIRSKSLGLDLTDHRLITGELSMNVPPFVNVAHDEASRKATLSVEDTAEKHQRAMWGMSFCLPFTRSV